MTLRKLIEAIERGDDFGIIPKAQAALGEIDANYGVGETVCRAFHGSLDAAKALHDALLPGWWWAVGTCKVSDDARVSPDDDSRAPSGGEWAEYTDIDQRPPGNPARAWLLSILIAVEGQAILRARIEAVDIGQAEKE